jgi:phosphatidylserine synthase
VGPLHFPHAVHLLAVSLFLVSSMAYFSTMNMAVIRSSKMSMDRVPQDMSSALHSYGWESLKSNKTEHFVKIFVTLIKIKMISH